MKPGEEQLCPRCGEWHVLEQKRADSRIPYEASMLFVTCRGQLHLAGRIDDPSPYPTRTTNALMAQPIPTQAGDVLVLGTAGSYVHVVGRISKDGQQDFRDQSDLKYERNRDAALAMARALCPPGRRIFLIDVDTDRWSEITDAG